MGEDAGEGVVWVDDDSGSGAGFEHGGDSGLDGGGEGDFGEGGAGAHDVADAGEEEFSQTAAGVEFGEVFGLKAAFLEQDHGEGITEAEHIGGAGGGGELEGAGFLFDVGVEDDVAVFGKGGAWHSGDGDDESGSFFDVGEKADHFGGLARIAEGDDEVAGGEESEVAMEGILAAEVDGGGTGAVEGGDEFLADVL